MAIPGHPSAPDRYRLSLVNLSGAGGHPGGNGARGTPFRFACLRNNLLKGSSAHQRASIIPPASRACPPKTAKPTDSITNRRRYRLCVKNHLPRRTPSAPSRPICKARSPSAFCSSEPPAMGGFNPAPQRAPIRLCCFNGSGIVPKWVNNATGYVSCASKLLNNSKIIVRHILMSQITPAHAFQPI